MGDGVVETVLDAGELAVDGLTAGVEPRVVDGLQPASYRRRTPLRRGRVAGAVRGSRREQPVGGLVPWPVDRVVERGAAIGQVQRVLALDRHATRRRRGSTAQRAWRSTSSMVSASSDGLRDVVAGELEATGRRLDPRGEQEGVGSVSWPGPRRRRRRVRPGSVARLGCRRARPTPNRTRWRWRARAADRVRALHVSAASMLARSVRAKARCSAWLPAAHTVGGGRGRVGEPRGVGGEGALGQSGVGHRFEREGADAVEQPVADRLSTRCRRRRSPASGLRAGRRRRSPRPPVPRAPRGRTPPPVGVRRRRRWRGPTGPAGRRGRAARSSIRSST